MIEQSKEYLFEHYATLKNFKRDFRNVNLFELVASHITSGPVVDVGCGAGFFLHLLKSKGLQVFGIEPNEGLRTIITEMHPDVRVIPGSAEDIAHILKEQVACVSMLDVLEHIENDEAQVDKIYRALQDDGTFVVVVPAHPALYGERDRSMGHYRRYSMKTLQELLSQHGFAVMHARYWNAIGVIPYIISEKIFKRPFRARLREGGDIGFFRNMLWKIINFWMREVENKFDFGFGLSIVCVAKKS